MARRTPEPPPTLIGYHAGFVSRLIAFVIDILIISGINLGVISISHLVANFLGFSFIFAPIDLSQPQWMTAVKAIVLSGIALSAFLVFVFYPILFWISVGQTPGKRFVGLRVVGMDNERIRFIQAVKRYVSYWISALPLFLGFFWVLIDDDRQAWHDKLADTKIVYDWDARYNASVVTALQERGRKRADKHKFVQKRLQKNNTTE